MDKQNVVDPYNGYTNEAQKNYSEKEPRCESIYYLILFIWNSRKGKKNPC